MEIIERKRIFGIWCCLSLSWSLILISMNTHHIYAVAVLDDDDDDDGGLSVVIIIAIVSHRRESE